MPGWPRYRLWRGSRSPLPRLVQLSFGLFVGSVTASQVENAGRTSKFTGPGVASYSFDEGSGSMAYDCWAGHHAQLHKASWTDDVNGNAIMFGGDGYTQQPFRTRVRSP